VESIDTNTRLRASVLKEKSVLDRFNQPNEIARLAAATKSLILVDRKSDLYHDRDYVGECYITVTLSQSTAAGEETDTMSEEALPAFLVLRLAFSAQDIWRSFTEQLRLPGSQASDAMKQSSWFDQSMTYPSEAQLNSSRTLIVLADIKQPSEDGLHHMSNLFSLALNVAQTIGLYVVKHYQVVKSNEESFTTSHIK
jgi:hypothetical protein